MNYSAYDELLKYFNFEFNIYIILLAIVAIGFLKTLASYRRYRNNKSQEITLSKSDLLISILAVGGLINAMYFQGVMADIPAEIGHSWQSSTFNLFIASIILLGLHIICFVQLKKWHDLR